MHVNRLVLDQFRSYRHLDLNLPAEGLRIAGDNGSGKTSLLEAIVMLSTTRSSRTALDREVVAWESGSDLGVSPYARILAEVETSDGRKSVSIGIELDDAGATTVRKAYQVNGESRRAQDLIGVLTCVLFSPEDVDLVTGGPAHRRREIDVLLSQTDRTYLRSLATYAKVLAQRNQLLRQFARERRRSRDAGAVTEISFWDEQLVSSGSVVVAYRHVISSFLGQRVVAHAQHLMTGGGIGLAYAPRIDLAGVEAATEVETALHHVAARFERNLALERENEFRRGMTLVGPHRDDFNFLIHDRDLNAYGSRGQQRLAVVAFKMACIDVIRARTGDTPVLLLDDVLSELDARHRGQLLDSLTTCGCQVLVTSTDRDLLDQPHLDDLPLMDARDGSLERIG